MLVSLFPICTARNIWSFRPQPGTTPVAVRVPKGSCLKPVPGLGLELFVPSQWDKLQRVAWNANAIMREARAGGRFRLAREEKAEAVG